MNTVYSECPTAKSRNPLDFETAKASDHLLGSSRIALNPDDVKNGLGRIVLTLVELLRELLERQAIRRIDAESLTEEEVERLGTTFLQLSEQMERLKKEFGLNDEDLNIDLGPLGKLL
jgi:cob(I)alamin adenosyltransferase